MKKLILIFFAVFITKTSQAQTYGVADTLAYLQTIVANKNQFIGHPFSRLADSLKIQIKYFSPFPSLPYDITKETSTTFAFIKPGSAEEIYLIYPCLEIHWYPFLDASQSINIFRYSRGGWVSNAATFYSTGIVANIIVKD